MIRSLSASFASLAMAVVVIRGAVDSSAAGDVILDGLVALIVYAIAGAFVGWILDYIIRDSLQSDFTNRVVWYRDGMTQLHSADSSDSV